MALEVAFSDWMVCFEYCETSYLLLVFCGMLSDQCFCIVVCLCVADDIFNKIKLMVEEEKLSWLKLACFVTDGAPAMASTKNGVVRKIKEKIIDEVSVIPFVHFHCIIHQGALCGHVLKVDNILKPVVKIINYIRSKSLNHRQFATFLKDIGCEHSDILYHSQIRWLSCERVLKRFWDLRHEIKMFLESKN